MFAPTCASQMPGAGGFLELSLRNRRTYWPDFFLKNFSSGGGGRGIFLGASAFVSCVGCECEVRAGFCVAAANRRPDCWHGVMCGGGVTSTVVLCPSSNRAAVLFNPSRLS